LGFSTAESIFAGNGKTGNILTLFCFILVFKNEIWCTYIKLECGPMPNVMAALPNIGGALCSTPQLLADAHYWSTVQ